MLSHLIDKFIDYIGKYNNYTTDEIEQAKYSLKILIYEIIKIILILIFFNILNLFKESLIIVFTMAFTKPFIGGYHEDSQIKCFLITSLLVAFIILLSRDITLNFINFLILHILSIFSIYNKAPIINDKMPISKKSLIKKNRFIGLTNILILSWLSIILYNIFWFSQAILWTILIQSVLMFNKYEGLKKGDI